MRSAVIPPGGGWWDREGFRCAIIDILDVVGIVAVRVQRECCMNHHKPRRESYEQADGSDSKRKGRLSDRKTPPERGLEEDQGKRVL